MHIHGVTVRLVAVGLVAVAALVASPAPAATPAEVKYANKVFSIVNDYRADHDRERLKRNKCLNRFAAKQAQAMANQERLFHQNLNKVANACDLGFVGENVAYGPFPAKTMVQAWLQSPPHHANIVKRQYRITGVAVRKGGGYWWAAQVFGKKL